MLNYTQGGKMKFLITLALAISIQASEVTWSEIDTRGSLRCVGQVTSSMPSICTSTVSVTMRTEVQCLDGTLKPAYKTLTSTQSGIYSSSTPGIYPTQVSSTQSGGIIEFEADVREGQNHEGSLEFTDSDAKVQCYEDGFVDPRDLIPAGTFENDSEYPTVGDNTQKELRFDNYSGGGWCEKGADSVISNGQNGEPETNKSFTCRDRDFETDREYILGTARYWIHSESEDPEDAVGDGYSELFPGGLINRQDFVGYRFSGASLHQRTTFSPIEGNPDITDYEENENDFRSKYSNQGRVEIVAKGLQDEQYTLKCS